MVAGGIGVDEVGQNIGADVGADSVSLLDRLEAARADR